MMLLHVLQIALAFDWNAFRRLDDDFGRRWSRRNWNDVLANGRCRQTWCRRTDFPSNLKLNCGRRMRTRAENLLLLNLLLLLLLLLLRLLLMMMWLDGMICTAHWARKDQPRLLLLLHFLHLLMVILECWGRRAVCSCNAGNDLIVTTTCHRRRRGGGGGTPAVGFAAAGVRHLRVDLVLLSRRKGIALNDGLTAGGGGRLVLKLAVVNKLTSLVSHQHAVGRYWPLEAVGLWS